MRILKVITTATMIAGLATTAQAGVDTLTMLNAYACGVPQAEFGAGASVSKTARYSRGKRQQTIGASRDRNAPAIAKLNIVYSEENGAVLSDNCTATIIDSRWLMTAAHCVAGDGWKRIEITTGSHSLTKGNPISRRADVALCHAGYRERDLTNDMALIRLDEPLPRDLEPARLPAQFHPAPPKGTKLMSAGWQVMGIPSPSDTLRTPRVKVENIERGGFLSVVDQAGGTKGVCQGESGGPLIIPGGGHMDVIGVLSAVDAGAITMTGGIAEPCTTAGYQMHYTPVARYRNWIDSIIDHCGDNPDSCRGREGDDANAGGLWR